MVASLTSSSTTAPSHGSAAAESTFSSRGELACNVVLRQLKRISDAANDWRDLVHGVAGLLVRRGSPAVWLVSRREDGSWSPPAPLVRETDQVLNLNGGRSAWNSYCSRPRHDAGKFLLRSHAGLVSRENSSGPPPSARPRRSVGLSVRWTADVRGSGFAN